MTSQHEETVTYVQLAWAGGEDTFQLAFDLVGADPLQYNLHSPHGPTFNPVFQLHDRVRAILGRLLDGTWGADDVSQPIRIGLFQGGGLNDDPIAARAEAEKLVREFVLDRPLADSLPLAQIVLIAAIMGVPKRLAEQVQAIDVYQGEVA